MNDCESSVVIYFTPTIPHCRFVVLLHTSYIRRESWQRPAATLDVLASLPREKIAALSPSCLIIALPRRAHVHEIDVSQSTLMP